MTNIDIIKYKEKEQYITRDPIPDKWRDHPNGQIMRHYSDIAKGHVLDFGCNHGACTFLLSEIGSIDSVIGYDINENSISLAIETKEKLKIDKVKFLSGNFLNENFDNYFDTIYTFHTLEHIYPEDLDYILQKFYVSLKSGGHIIVCVPYEKCYNDPAHVNYFNSQNLADIFTKNNFKTLECIEDNRWSESGLVTGIFLKQ